MITIRSISTSEIGPSTSNQPDRIRSRRPLSEPCPFWRRTTQWLFWASWHRVLAEKHWNQLEFLTEKNIDTHTATLLVSGVWNDIFFFCHDILQVPNSGTKKHTPMTLKSSIVAILPSAPVSPGGKQGSGHLGMAGSMSVGGSGYFLVDVSAWKMMITITEYRFPSKRGVYMGILRLAENLHLNAYVDNTVCVYI